MFDFLKRKKEEEFSAVESADAGDEVKGLESSNLDLGINPSPLTPEQPVFSSSSSGVVTERDVQLILARIDLLTKKLEEVDRKVSDVLEIAKQGK